MHPDELPEYINIPGPVRTMIGQHLPRDIVVRGGWEKPEKSYKDRALTMFHSHFLESPPGLAVQLALGTAIFGTQIATGDNFSHPRVMIAGYGVINHITSKMHNRADVDYPVPFIPLGANEPRPRRMQRLQNSAAHQRINLKFMGLVAAGLGISAATMVVPEVQTDFLENQTAVLDFPTSSQNNSGFLADDYTVTL
jgi:hypothetical protein